MTITGRGADQYPLRLPEGMRDEIAAAAKAAGRSMNNEIILRLAGDADALRDRFAFEAFVGSWNREAAPLRCNDGETVEDALKRYWAGVARTAYIAADAFLAARKAGA
ncbi:Arc family DNA-binding protein [Rhizobium sp. YIM 134829]|uniref:Arc family DNA-binding protein n=1 Tax=Rhizobium sp. YIM 134829 TaxID=3390453 RepID=UPI003978B3F6